MLRISYGATTNKGGKVEKAERTRKELKVVRIGHEAEWRQESREEMTGRGPQRKEKISNAVGGKSSHLEQRLRDIIGFFSCLRERGRVRLPMCKQQM